jgi:hypothetical protein
MTQEERQYNIMVYGIERVGLKKPLQEIANRNFKLVFESYNTEKRFNEFDGVILFQGIFEAFDPVHGINGSYMDHSCDHNELDKRKKELSLLERRQGFVCYILCKDFLDSYYSSYYSRTQDFHDTDLCKYSLNLGSLHRGNFEGRDTQVHCVKDEFKRFLELHGAARTYFRVNDGSIDLRTIAVVDRAIVGMILFGKEFFIPSLLPENTEDRLIEYFTILADALTSAFNKTRFEIPRWVAQFVFEKEGGLMVERKKLLADIESVDIALSKYTRYKKVLLGSGELLVKNVAKLLENGFSLKVDSEDEFREDLKILDAESKTIILAEVKGTNGGVKREYINQADNHRERANLPPEFPTLLLINTHVKNSVSIEGKDQPLPEDQVSHATKIGVLIVRTLDLLFLMRHFDNGRITQQELTELFTTKVGWLRADVDTWKIVQ